MNISVRLKPSPKLLIHSYRFAFPLVGKVSQYVTDEGQQHSTNFLQNPLIHSNALAFPGEAVFINRRVSDTSTPNS